jgi:hypothetical protein
VAREAEPWRGLWFPAVVSALEELTESWAGKVKGLRLAAETALELVTTGQATKSCVEVSRFDERQLWTGSPRRRLTLRDPNPWRVDVTLTDVRLRRRDGALVTLAETGDGRPGTVRIRSAEAAGTAEYQRLEQLLVEQGYAALPPREE